MLASSFLFLYFPYIFPRLFSSSLCLLHLLFTDFIQRSSYLQSLLYSILHAIVANLLTLASSQSWYPRVRHHRLLSACFVHQLLDHHSSPRGMFAADLCPSHSAFTHSSLNLITAIQDCQNIVRPYTQCWMSCSNPWEHLFYQVTIPSCRHPHMHFSTDILDTARFSHIHRLFASCTAFCSRSVACEVRCLQLPLWMFNLL